MAQLEKSKKELQTYMNALKVKALKDNKFTAWAEEATTMHTKLAAFVEKASFCIAKASIVKEDEAALIEECLVETESHQATALHHVGGSKAAAARFKGLLK